ncbi:aminopeptidase [Micromonospora echinospora]|uniref:D-aminopeptidase n=1 Tax=Micromonospora echinospora TaxID=1877 RepID=A0A1C4U6A4_MICEC|nr:P1 family peptidase [Micromonospora echinospora]OZV73194.1 aminopeptidase [Micromonospora echinospora]SCE67182.1 D-aminopeptidase [Micromonospora echinospora]
MDESSRRARDLGILVGALPTGRHNAITDVPGVLVGHTTVDDGADVRTGVTAVVPSQLGPGRWTLPAAVHCGNGYGKLVGSTQVDELGVLESPIVLTATLSVFRVADALLGHLMGQRPDGVSFNPLVGETNDGHLSDIRRRPITEAHVLAALAGASAEPPAEGCVGAGTGTTALGYKADRATPPGNSCMIVVATDLPLDARQLGRVARRAVFAMGRVGASFSHGSGDYAIAFSTAEATEPPIRDGNIDPVFTAVLDAVEEALLNSLLAAVTTTGVKGRTSHAVPHDAVVRRLSAAGRLASRS